jgi:hypothetical protein
MGVRLKKIDRPDNVDDCIRIRSVLESFGYSVTLDDACDLWQELSSKRACGWRYLPEEDDKLRYIIGEYTGDVEYDLAIEDEI